MQSLQIQRHFAVSSSGPGTPLSPDAPHSPFSSSSFCSSTYQQHHISQYNRRNKEWCQLLNKDKAHHIRDYLVNNRSLPKNVRSITVAWISDVCWTLECSVQCFHLAVYLFDRYLSNAKRVLIKEIQDIACACMLLAIKHEGDEPPSIEKMIVSFGGTESPELVDLLCVISDGASTRPNVLRFEQAIMTEVRFEFCHTTIHEYWMLLNLIVSDLCDAYDLIKATNNALHNKSVIADVSGYLVDQYLQAFGHQSESNSLVAVTCVLMAAHYVCKDLATHMLNTLCPMAKPATRQAIDTIWLKINRFLIGQASKRSVRFGTLSSSSYPRIYQRDIQQAATNKQC